LGKKPKTHPKGVYEKRRKGGLLQFLDGKHYPEKDEKEIARPREEE